jgi:type II secretory pathway pseudopilin PulG
MNRHHSFSPVLIEFLIVMLFLALSTASVIQLLAKASELSQLSVKKSEALICLENALEQARSNPEGNGAFDQEGNCMLIDHADGIDIRVLVKKTKATGGFYYDIQGSVSGDGQLLAQMETSRYVINGEAGK